MKTLELSKLYIIQYFDDLINQIDINAEYQLLAFSTVEHQNKINTTRNGLINEINTIKKYNLDSLNRHEIQENIKYDFIIKDIQATRMLFKKFCFFINPETFNYFKDEFNDLGFLVVTDFYLSENEINYIMYLFRLFIFKQIMHYFLIQ